MTKTIVPWRATAEELQRGEDTFDVISQKCIDWKNSSIEDKHAMFLAVRKDPTRKITYEELLGFGEVFGDMGQITSLDEKLIPKEDAFNLIKQLIYFAVMGRKVPMDYDDQQIILQFARIRLSFFEGV